MPSGKQRRAQLMARRRARKSTPAPREPEAPRDSAPVDVSQLAPDNSYGVPIWRSRGYYEDIPFVCRDCGEPGVWTALSQKHWYEVVKGQVWTLASRCRDCRRKERERKAEARRVHLEGLARKAAKQRGED